MQATLSRILVGDRPELNALIGRMQTAGSKPNDARKKLISNLVRDLILPDIWRRLDIVYAIAAHASGPSLLNWKNPAFTCSLVDSPAFEIDRGYTGNGSSSYLTTGWRATDGPNFVQDDSSLWAWSRSDIQETASISGVVAATGAHLAVRSAADNFGGRLNENTATTRTNTNGAGFFGINRADSATKRYWRNGVQIGADVSVATTGISSGTARICSAGGSDFSTRQIAFAAWGSSLTGLELPFYNAVNTYMTAIGAA